MQAREKVLDDIARMAGGTVSLFAGLRQQIKEEIRVRVNEAALRMDFVPRGEFERLEAMLVKAREDQEDLLERVQKLESGPKKKTAKRQK